MKKISWNLAHQVKVWCTLNNVTYSSGTQYPNTLSAAEKKGLRSTCGMLYHLPRTIHLHFPRKEEWERVYICWFGEPLDQVIETAAFLHMTSKRQVWLLRCKRVGDSNGQQEQASIQARSSG